MHQFRMAPSIVPVEDVRSWDFEKFGYDEALRILKAGGFPTRTVLCANDRVAFGVLAAAYQLGLKVGHRSDCDIRVAGHDDHPLSRYACPPITTVAQNYNEIGRLAIELLLKRLDENSSAATRGGARVLLNAELMLRSSA
jgi:DNA-binding LacI/PurR family transcriptional regulator